MPIYYQKVPTQNEDENMNSINQQEANSKIDWIKQNKSNSYYELSEYDSTLTNSILSLDKIYLEENIELERIETRYGSVIVAKQTYGLMSNKKSTDDSNPITNQNQEQKRMKLNSIILTIHDVGLNYESNYLQFFNNLDAKILLKNFTVYHINLPGQHTSCEQFESIYSYPSMDRLSEIIDFVVSYYDIENFIGFGQGAGANLLIRFAIKKPNKVNGLFLINPTYSQASWVEWIYQKRNIKHLQADRNTDKNSNKTLLLSPIVQDYLIYLQFGKASPERDLDSLRIIEEYRNYFKSRFIDSINLSLFIDSYVKRKFINLSKDGLKGTNKLQCECTILAGSLSSMCNQSNQLYLRLSPDKANWIKFDNCGNPLLEKPIKVFEIFKLFLLGLGYTIKHSNSTRPSQIKKSASAGVVLNEANSCLIDFSTAN